jgi:vacuolar protein sorting-associated protein 16
MSAHLSLSPDPVLKHWACAKIARSKTGATEADDDEVCRVIVKKFESVHAGSDTVSSGLVPVRGGVSYAEIARRAWEVGRAGLATKLLDHEPRAGEQVPLLLSMKEDKLALVKAVDSGDTDLGKYRKHTGAIILTHLILVYHVLLHLYKRLPLGTFFRLIEDGGAGLELANRLLQVYAREQNREMLRDFYYSDDRRVESAVLSLEEARHAEVCLSSCAPSGLYLIPTIGCHCQNQFC